MSVSTPFADMANILAAGLDRRRRFSCRVGHMIRLQAMPNWGTSHCCLSTEGFSPRSLCLKTLCNLSICHRASAITCSSSSLQDKTSTASSTTVTPPITTKSDSSYLLGILLSVKDVDDSLNISIDGIS